MCFYDKRPFILKSLLRKPLFLFILRGFCMNQLYVKKLWEKMQIRRMVAIIKMMNQVKYLFQIPFGEIILLFR
jgi:hypothetical protein